MYLFILGTIAGDLCKRKFGWDAWEIYGVLAFGIFAVSFAWTTANIDISTVLIPEFRQAFGQKVDEFWQYFVSGLIGAVIGVIGSLAGSKSQRLM